MSKSDGLLEFVIPSGAFAIGLWLGVKGAKALYKFATRGKPKHCCVCGTRTWDVYQCAMRPRDHCCHKCMKKWLWMQRGENSGTAEANRECFNRCGASLTLHRVQQVLSAPEYHAYCEQTTKTYFARQMNMLWCRCGAGYFSDSQKLTARCYLRCLECEQWTCGGPAGCGEMFRSRKQLKRHQCNTESYGKKCDGCGVGLVKSRGCNTVRCTVCNSMNDIGERDDYNGAYQYN